MPHENSRASASSRLTLRNAGIVSGSLAALLTAEAVLSEQSRSDVWAINTVQKLELPYLESAITAFSTLTGSTGANAMWAIALIAVDASRRWLPALATLTLPTGGFINHVVGEYLVGRTRPDPDVVTRTVADIEAASR